MLSKWNLIRLWASIKAIAMPNVVVNGNQDSTLSSVALVGSSLVLHSTCG